MCTTSGFSFLHMSHLMGFSPRFLLSSSLSSNVFIIPQPPPYVNRCGHLISSTYAPLRPDRDTWVDDTTSPRAFNHGHIWPPPGDSTHMPTIHTPTPPHMNVPPMGYSEGTRVYVTSSSLQSSKLNVYIYTQLPYIRGINISLTPAHLCDTIQVKGGTYGSRQST